MFRKKLAESLTARIFIITVLILLGTGTITFGLIAWATPSTYTAVVNDELTRQVNTLVQKLSNITLDDSGALLDEFIRSSGANAILVGPNGEITETGSQLASQPVYEDSTTMVTTSEGDSTVTYTTEGSKANDTVTVTMSEQATITSDVRFADQTGLYTLYVTPQVEAENLAVRALIQIAPWLLLVLLAFSVLCAFVYSRYVTCPIVRLSSIADKMAKLDFNWSCGETRRDEIGQLGRSLDGMARRLDTALQELKATNHALRGEVEQERELERQRMAFFSAASHELKTPVTILKGQLTGMLEGIGIYKDRDKYLLRSLQVTGRMENLIQEMLTISRMETGSVAIKKECIDLSALIKRQLSLDVELLEQRSQLLICQLAPEITINGDPALLGKAMGNLLSNASFYSPRGAEIYVWCGKLDGYPALTVENTDAYISKDALPHLFEPFYREENSRSRSTGGNGLGLYLVKMILEQHEATCAIENTKAGVKATVFFNALNR